MLARHFALRARRSHRATVAWLAAAWYLAIALGVPLPWSDGKDLSRPFLCMYSRCGCQNAEQCYRSCCCHTPAERLAFAREHGETPPPELLAAADAETLRVAPPRRSCCANRCDGTTNPESFQAIEAHDHAQVVIQESLACRGAGHVWLHAGAALTPVVVELQSAITEVGVSHPRSLFADTLPPVPPSRPPRAG